MLIIDDDEGIRDTLQIALEWNGYITETAANGKKALESLAQLPRPCLILLDLMMPVMNGWEFMNALNHEPISPPPPVIVVTAFPEKIGPIQSQGLLRKPINLDELLQLTDNYCKRQ